MALDSLVTLLKCLSNFTSDRGRGASELALGDAKDDKGALGADTDEEGSDEEDSDGDGLFVALHMDCELCNFPSVSSSGGGVSAAVLSFDMRQQRRRDLHTGIVRFNVKPKAGVK